MPARLWWLLLLIAVVGIGLASLVVAWRLPGATAMTTSASATVLVLAAGWTLAAAGLDVVRRGRRRLFGTLLGAAGASWLIAEWASPAAGSSLTFTAGLALGPLVPVAIGHALAVDAGFARRPSTRLFVAIGYGIFGGLLGLVPSLTFDPVALGCNRCPPSALGLAPSVAVSQGTINLGATLGAIWVMLAAAIVTRALLAASPAARRSRLPVVLPGVAFLGVVALDLARSVGRGARATDATAHQLHLVAGGLLVALAAGVVLESVQAFRSRNRIARIVAELRSSPPAGGLRNALAAALNDPDLQISYPIDGGLEVDAEGATSSSEPRPGRARTPIVRDGEVVAILDHPADVLGTSVKMAEVVRAARLGLEHERLQAAARAHLAEIAAARRRIVATADAERRALERDLHDGAQQHLIALSIRLRVLEAEVFPDDRRTLGLLEDARRDLAHALDDLREVAHGIYPSILATEGLVAAIEGLAEGAAVPVRVESLVLGRLPAAVEAAAYGIVAEAVNIGAGAVLISGEIVGDRFTLEVDGPALPDTVVVDLGDRVGAAAGQLDIRPATQPGRIVLTAELPCAS
ncbi:MAG: hypothetical protein H0U52_14050 [Chloroflexi bacterium]|nr:hypothetical protein [Chloroflexota bacterium]